jgi:hypothetical protein
MSIESEEAEKLDGPDRWTLIRDVAVFQIKLLFDGFRDLLLLPISLIAGIVSLVKGGREPSSEFYDLLRIGRRSERWINLFGAASHLHGPPSDEDRFPVEDVDEMVSRVESYVVDEYRRGGVTAQAKERLDKALDLLHRKARRQKSGEDEA